MTDTDSNQEYKQGSHIFLSYSFWLTHPRIEISSFLVNIREQDHNASAALGFMSITCIYLTREPLRTPFKR